MLKAIGKVRQDPTTDGYGTPLGTRRGRSRAGLLTTKLHEGGIRVVYQLLEVDGAMRIVLVGMRADNEV